MSDSSGAIDLFFDMPPGKRMSPERRFDMTSEYERGRLGVRAHLLVSASVTDRAAASFQGAMCSGVWAWPQRARSKAQTSASSSLASLDRLSELRSERSMRFCAVFKTSDDVSALQNPIVSLRCSRASLRSLRASSKVSSFEIEV